MTVNIFNNIFSDNELKVISYFINKHTIPKNEFGEYVDYDSNNGTGKCLELGRLQIGNIVFPDNISKKISNIVKNISKNELKMDHVLYVEYNNKYGTPDLPPHFDHDTNDLVVDFQLSSNTSWDLAVDLKTYPMFDNSALIFNANEHLHWRPHKIFNDGEYIKMLFFRFYNEKNRPDYSYKEYSKDHEIFKQAYKFRDSLLNKNVIQ